MNKISINKDFRIVKTFKNKGIFEEYIFIDKTQSDYTLIKNIGIEFARLGKSVKATPTVHFKSIEYALIYGTLENTIYYRKCPDLIVDGIFYEVESYSPPFKKEKISNMINKGSVQSSRIIINNNKGASDRYIRDNIYKRLKDKKFKRDINELWLYEKGKLRLLYKKQ